MLLERYSYVPLVRTREAELKGFGNLDSDTLDSCLPIMEITRSRRSKSNPEGEIERSFDEIRKILDGRKFILDVTVERDYSNAQTERLLEPNNSFANWVAYIAERSNPDVIPMIHIADGMRREEIATEAARLSEYAELLAIRLDYSDAYISDVMVAVNEGIGDPGRVVVVLDAGFIQTRSEADHDDLMVMAIDSVSRNGRYAGLVTLSSSFPASVKDKGYGDDQQGQFPMSEVLLTRLVKQQRPGLPIYHGDYSSIHPLRYPAAFGGWVPRVDVPLNDQYYYHRYRRDDGGYVRAAREALDDELYENAGAWGDEQIAKAAEGEPEGRNPSHWIAVRTNIHITRQSRQWIET